ncbi:uncharacterized protein LOC132703311 [Cylas formicarius]|uniref:uncharacterized protein LOC132703311 n=1 Tax=Cylas formicarius TaxID=197179 RepID=UPI0029586D3E|nr:uncharacterized protein LOC132703311 [Cylas formicarius]
MFSSAVITLILIISLFIVVSEQSRPDYKILNIEDPKLCSPITKRKIRTDGLIVKEGRSINKHSITWTANNHCNFEVQSSYRGGGILAVIQHLNLRRNSTTGECIDYVEFSSREVMLPYRYCDIISADVAMGTTENATSHLPILRGSYMNSDGELNTVIHISKIPLSYEEHTGFEIVFTSYADCSDKEDRRTSNLKPCIEKFDKVCINKEYFSDGVVNCPFYGCTDELSCSTELKEPVEPRWSAESKVIIGSISSIFVLFTFFILCLWVFKKHKLLCWAEDFAHPCETTSNRNSRVMELSEQTGARLARSTDPQPNAPPAEEEKDLPPSYDSLFPDGPG